eukprot:3425759-Rhodomonas_salina.2
MGYGSTRHYAMPGITILPAAIVVPLSTLFQYTAPPHRHQPQPVASSPYAPGSTIPELSTAKHVGEYSSSVPQNL